MNQFSFRKAIFQNKFGVYILFNICVVFCFVSNAFFFYSSVVWDIMRCWVKLHPVKRKKETAPGTAILSKEPVIQVSFEAKPGANPVSRQKKLLRYQENPESNWGPKPRYSRCF